MMNEINKNPIQSENIDALMGALAKAQGDISAAAKDSSNPFYNAKYADLNSVWNACRDSLSKNGLAVIQTMNQNDDGAFVLTTTLGHSSGQWIKSYLPIKYDESATEIDKYGKEKKANPLQKLGSCLTYLRRYALAAIVGVAPDEDDDGNSGGDVYKNQNRPQYNTSPAQAPVAKPKPLIITKFQVEELNNIIADDNTYRHTMLVRLAKNGVSCIEEIPASIFDKVVEDALNNKKKVEVKDA